jgi:hypothetical protein
MSSLLRSLLVLGVTGLLVVGCGEKEEAAPAEAAPAVEAAPAAEAAAPAAAEPGGYEPTAEERVPGITIDPATLAAESAAPAAEAAPAAAE